MVKVLKASEVLTLVAISAKKMEDKNGDVYHRVRIGDRNGILREDAVAAIQSGDCATLSYEETETHELDPESGEETGNMRQTFSYLNHSTFTQVKNVAKNERELKEIEEGVQVNDEFVANLAKKLNLANRPEEVLQ